MRPNLSTRPSPDATRRHSQAINELLSRLSYILIKTDGQPTAGQVVLSFRSPLNMNMVAGAFLMRAETASTGTADWLISVDGVQVGTVSFATSATGVVTLTNDLIPQGSLFAVTAPSPQDATLSDITISIAVSR